MHYAALRIAAKFLSIVRFWDRDANVLEIVVRVTLVSTRKIMSKGQGFGFGLNKMKELSEAFKKAQQVQEGAKKLQEELEAMNIEGQAGGGMVKVVLSGNQEPRRVEISPDVLSEGADVVSDLVTAAMKDAYDKSTTTMRERMEELTGGLNIPGL